MNHYPEAIQREKGKPWESYRWGTRAHDADNMNLIQPAEVIARLRDCLPAPEQNTADT